MNAKQKKLLKEAAEALKIVDVALFGSRFAQEHSLPKRKDAELVQQHMEGWSSNMTKEREERWLQVVCSFGVRLVKEDDTDDDQAPHVYYTIEADFIAHYKLTDGELSNEAIETFVEFNAKHNVWPFWREYVFATCQRARISPPEIGLYSRPASD